MTKPGKPVEPDSLVDDDNRFVFLWGDDGDGDQTGVY